MSRQFELVLTKILSGSSGWILGKTSLNEWWGTGSAQGGGGFPVPGGDPAPWRCGTEGCGQWAWWGWAGVGLFQTERFYDSMRSETTHTTWRPQEVSSHLEDSLIALFLIPALESRTSWKIVGKEGKEREQAGRGKVVKHMQNLPLDRWSKNKFLTVLLHLHRKAKRFYIMAWSFQPPVPT